MDKTLSYIGLCRKAGKIVLGTDMTADAVRDGKIKLALLSSDASKNTVKRITDCCAYRGVKLVTLPFTNAQIGHATGKSSTAAAGITDDNFAALILKSFQTFQEQHKSI